MITEDDEYPDASYYGEHFFREEDGCIDISKYRYVSHNQARYFKSQHYPYNPKNWVRCPKENIQKIIDKYGSMENACLQYALQDYDRLQDLYNGKWNYKFLYAQAVIILNPDDPKNRTAVKIESTSCGGIESDSGNEHYNEIYLDLIYDLSHTLRSFGFSQQQIDAAVIS
jgi:hypothetical protein